jgi:hypothetical protein
VGGEGCNAQVSERETGKKNKKTKPTHYKPCTKTKIKCCKLHKTHK